jgi:hypothetical protein
MDAERYTQMFRDCLIPELQKCQIDVRNLWLQQDVAAAHTARRRIEQFADYSQDALSSGISVFPGLHSRRTLHLHTFAFRDT